MKGNKVFSYENKLLILLSFIFGFVLFDRMALNFLVPFFEKELHLNNTQIGLLASLLALAWAISGFVIGRLSDKTGHRKKYLLISGCHLFYLFIYIRACGFVCIFAGSENYHGLCRRTRITVDAINYGRCFI
jgi:MFS family permease